AFEWPIDLMEYKNSEGEYCLCYAFQQNEGRMKSFYDILCQKKDNKILDWRNPDTQKVCISFLKAMIKLHKSGYIYNDFNLKRMFYNAETDNVFLRFSPLMRTIGSATGFDAVCPKDISVEFRPPCLYKLETFFPNEGIDCYSIAALLFRLMIGRLPYEGREMSGNGEVLIPGRELTPTEYDIYFERYLLSPRFIFDTEDDRNSLGPMQENDLPRERWEALSKNVKIMFMDSFNTKAFSGSSVERYYKPEEWLNSFEQLIK
ncbi:MAG TPA: hypothetical protein PLN48_17725, partial [Lachnospiraceae bacterium]|nr:hypothetical protein [Lachnospiraceae bacterium]